MRAADFHDLVPLLRLGGEIGVQPLQCRNQVAANRKSARDVHGRRESVVRRLPHVHVIIRVDGALFTLRTDAMTQLLIRHVRDYFVRIRIGRSAGTRLINIHGKMSVVLTGGDFFTCRDDGFCLLLVEFAEFLVRAGTRGFEIAERVNHCGRHRLMRNGKVLDRAGGRCAVQCVAGHLHLAHRVAFSSEAAHRVRISIIETNWLRACVVGTHRSANR